MKTFEAGKTYYYRFICDNDTIVKCTVTKRTAKTITFTDDCGETTTRRIYVNDNSEKVAVEHYSMAPILSAAHTVEALEEAEKKSKAAKEEAEKKAQEERKIASETTQKVAESAVTLYAAMHPIKEGKPTVKIGMSEMRGLPGCSEEYLEVSLKAADMILGTLDMWQHEVRESSDYFGYYHKTNFIITYTENGEANTYEGRYDIGDGEGGLLNHIRNRGEWYRTHEEFGKVKETPDETNDILEFVKMLEKAA